jgi:hypothetical protein
MDAKSIEEQVLGKWALCSMDLCALYQFLPDHSFTVSLPTGNQPDGDLFVAGDGTWHVVATEFVIETQWRQLVPDEPRRAREVQRWRIVHVSRDELVFDDDIRLRRCDEPKAPNQAMQRTASKTATDVLRVCHHPLWLRGRLQWARGR